MGLCCSVGVAVGAASASDTDGVASSDRSSGSRVRARIVIGAVNNGAPYPAGHLSPANNQRSGGNNIGSVPFFYDSPTHTSGRRTQSDEDSVKFCSPTTTTSGGQAAPPQRRPVSFVTDPDDAEDAGVMGPVPSYMNVLSQHGRHHSQHLPVMHPQNGASCGGRGGSSGGSSRRSTATPNEDRNPLIPGKDAGSPGAARNNSSNNLDAPSYASALSTVTNHLGIGLHPGGLPQLVDALALELCADEVAAGGPHAAAHRPGSRAPAIASLAHVLSVGSASSHDLRTFAVYEEPPTDASTDGTERERPFGSPWVGQQPQGLHRGLGSGGVFAEPDSPARLRQPLSGAAEQQVSIWEEGTHTEVRGQPEGAQPLQALLQPTAYNDLLEVPSSRAIDNLEML